MNLLVTRDQWETIQIYSRELGFDLIGATPAFPVPDQEHYEEWIEKKHHANMAYLERGLAKRQDPRLILPEIASVICVGVNYQVAQNTGTPIARYAQGADYHDVIGKKLEKLGEFLKTLFPELIWKSYVDTGPILERSYAARAGLGWIGKNTCLINDGLGSYFFIGEILSNLELPSAYGPLPLDLCGSCTRCLEACPTGAFEGPQILNANQCISYLTIEHKPAFTDEQTKMLGPHVYGCDICQEVCPYNDRIPEATWPEFRAQHSLASQPPETWPFIPENEFKTMTQGTAMSRIKHHQWQRNLKSARTKP